MRTGRELANRYVMSERIKDYWNQRAGENSGSLTATTQDIWLRRLEVASLIGMLEKLNLPPDAQRKALRAFNKLLWVQNDLIVRHYARH